MLPVSQSTTLIATSYEIVFLTKADSSTDVAATFAAATHTSITFMCAFLWHSRHCGAIDPFFLEKEAGREGGRSAARLCFRFGSGSTALHFHYVLLFA